MKVSELFEAVNKVDHGAIGKFLIGTAIKYLKAPPAIKRDATELAATTDTFYDSSIDEVTSAAKKFIDGRSEFDDVLDAMDYALESIGSNIVEHYKNKMNHPPGYKVPSPLDFDSYAIPSTVLQGIKKIVPALAIAHREITKVRAQDKKAGEKAKLASITPQMVQSLIDLLKKSWSVAFSEKIIKKLNDKPGSFDMPTMNYKSEKDVISALKKTAGKEGPLYSVIEWVLSNGASKNPEDNWFIIRQPSLLKQIVAGVPQLKGIG